MPENISINHIKKTTCESALNQLKRKIPYGWDLNIYRGCSHQCRYCYAIYSHERKDASRYLICRINNSNPYRRKGGSQ